ncbi:hypothetical protein BS50DRAFT_641723 [Corynespora cassiicola Philippines]|uniref:Uncharacterized protein n=1 Tax=Corynespora cassiicola Philippines TaxID=1448308 RepID=A0A2T2MZ66_CORCC|nr:hypothetical protein BS50DRAFT_641723 [Corynespora cassiicola Philippines]
MSNKHGIQDADIYNVDKIGFLKGDIAIAASGSKMSLLTINMQYKHRAPMIKVGMLTPKTGVMYPG